MPPSNRIASIPAIRSKAKPKWDWRQEIRQAVAHHVFEEESTWFLALRESAESATQSKLSRLYKAEFARYMGEDAV